MLYVLQKVCLTDMGLTVYSFPLYIHIIKVTLLSILSKHFVESCKFVKVYCSKKCTPHDSKSWAAKSNCTEGFWHFLKFL